MMSPQDIEAICARLLCGEIHQQAVCVTLEEFRVFYEAMLRRRGRHPEVSLVNLESVVKVQFSDVSPQHFDISHSRPLREADFSFVQNRKWYGAQVPPQGFTAFAWGELRLNWLKIIPLFLAMSSLLYLVDNRGLYDLLSQLLIQSATVFLSVYLIFTVSQNQALAKDVSLFASGILHRYYRDDRNVTLLGLATIGLTFLSAVVVAGLYEHIDNGGGSLHVIARIARAGVMGAAVTLLFDTFLTILDYYLDRGRDVADRDAASAILHRDYQEHVAGGAGVD